jgi:hypothetical protein
MRKIEISIEHRTEVVDGVVISERLILNDESVPDGGIPRSISFHPSYTKELIKKLKFFENY